MKTILKNESAEITIKKSKFIANIFQANSEKEAKEILNRISKKYYDAKHNCYAFVIQESYESNLKERASDNGEPQGTAGAPILEIIKRNNLSNVIIIVTRYFGGILLGTGGLTRAYSEAAKAALKKCEIIEKNFGDEFIIYCNYENQKDVIYELNKLNIKIKKQNFEENIKIYIQISKEYEEEFLKKFKQFQEQNKCNIKIEKINENILF